MRISKPDEKSPIWKGKYRALILALGLMALGAGCTFEDWDYTWNGHGIGVNYDGELSFALIEPNKGDFSSAGAAPQPRSGHASAVFKDKLWIFGGYNPNARGEASSYLADVWYSEDGYAWHAATLEAPWKGRRGHQVVVYKDALYLVGGYKVVVEGGISYGGAANDVWKSTDGINWTQIKANSYKTAATHPGLAAAEDVRGSDLYDPSDDLDWYPRLNHGLAAYDADGAGPQGEVIALFGGFSKEWMPYLNDGNLDETRRYFADFWTSEDGATWVQEDPMSLGNQDATLFGKYKAGRAEAAHFLHNGELYMAGGTSWFNFQEHSQGFVVPGWDRVWNRSSAGWVVAGPSNYEYIDRRGHKILEYEGNFWILPGSKPAAVQWYKGADSIWKITMNPSGGIIDIALDGSYRAGSPMYGIAHYSAEVFTPKSGPDSGKSAMYVLCGDGDGGVRNTLWRITKTAEED
jgi:hypothetical protein